MTLSIIVIAISASISSVVAALRLLGLRKAGTPLEIASTPVSAAQPDENARASMNISATVVSSPSHPGDASICSEALSTCGSWSVASRNMPHTHMVRMAAMNTYVGNAKKAPDSRMPRRFIAISTTTRTIANVASWPLRVGSAAAAYWAPEEIDTATVMT